MSREAFDSPAELARYVSDCARARRRLVIAGGGSKAFYGNAAAGAPVSPAGSGISEYVAGELYIRARAATPLADIIAALDEKGQMLPFDPPQYGGGGTFGGAIAAGLAGPAKPRYGSVRDAMLGAQIINGNGELLNFGGRVMKNVAGFDVSRLMAGAHGTLGIITEATVKALPRPAAACTLSLSLPPDEAVDFISQSIRRSLPLAASFYQRGRLFIRLEGGSVNWAAAQLGGAARREEEQTLWRQVRDHTLPFFNQRDKPLWRISVPPSEKAAQAYSDLIARGEMVFEWHGAVFWQAGGEADAARRQAQQLGGYACLFRRGETTGGDIPFLPPLPAAHQALHERLKHAFDPAGILNIGRMYGQRHAD